MRAWLVNPEATRAQFEGAAVVRHKLLCRSGEITATKGDRPIEFQDYPVARITEVPYQTNVYIFESDAPPAGVGEQGCRHLWRRSATPFLLQRQACEGSADLKARLKLTVFCALCWKKVSSWIEKLQVKEGAMTPDKTEHHVMFASRILLVFC